MLIREYDDRLSMSSEPRTCGKHIRGSMFAAIAETGGLDLTVTLEQIYEHGPCLFHFKQSFNYNCASIKTNAKSVRAICRCSIDKSLLSGSKNDASTKSFKTRP